MGIGQDLADKLPPDAGQIEILRSDELKTAQNIAVAIKGLALALIDPHLPVLRPAPSTSLATGAG